MTNEQTLNVDSLELEPVVIGQVSELTGNDSSKETGGDRDNIVWGNYD